MFIFSHLCDKRLFFFCLAYFFCLCMAMKLTGGSGFLLIFPLVLVGFGKNKAEFLLFSLLLTAILTITNAVIAPKNMVFSLCNRIVYLLVGGVMSLQVLTQRRSPVIAPMLGMLFFIGYMALSSSVGWQPIISYLKLFLFLVTFFAFYSAANTVSSRMRMSAQRVRAMLLACASIEILGSIALLPFPRLGMMRVEEFFLTHGYIPEGSLFMGMTFHSQSLGPIIAMVGCFLFADLLFFVRRWEPFYILLLLCSSILIYKTGSRTAMGTFVVGFAFVGFSFMLARGIGSSWKNRVLGALMVISVIGGLALVATPQLRSATISFIYKARGGEVAEEKRGYSNFVASRQGLMDRAIENFLESPWIGNGFQVSSQMQELEITSYKQLLSAPVEKGVWITAILEEGGVFGFLIFVGVILYILNSLLSHHAYMGATTFFVTLVINLGEFTLFSMSGVGGVFWAFIFMGLALDVQQLRQRKSIKIQRWQEYESPPIIRVLPQG